MIVENSDFPFAIRHLRGYLRTSPGGRPNYCRKAALGGLAIHSIVGSFITT